MEFITLKQNNQLYEAALFTIDGEVMNVIVKDNRSFKPGDILQCQIEDTQFEATVIKTDQYNLFLYVAYHDYPILDDRRKSVRCNIDVPGVIYQNENPVRNFPIQILDLSIKGIGFKSMTRITEDHSYSLKFNIEKSDINLRIAIKNEIKLGTGLRYGSAITDISEQNYFLLRKYLLAYQLKRI